MGSRISWHSGMTFSVSLRLVNVSVLSVQYEGDAKKGTKDNSNNGTHTFAAGGGIDNGCDGKSLDDTFTMSSFIAPGANASFVSAQEDEAKRSFRNRPYSTGVSTCTVYHFLLTL